MLSRRLTSDSQPRRKNGQPPHNTTGVARTSWIHTAARGAIKASKAGLAIWSAIAMTSSGNDNATPTAKRRVMSRSSGLAASPAAGSLGSSAMPQIGQEPGAARTICGCIGQVHWPAAVAGTGATEARVR